MDKDNRDTTSSTEQQLANFSGKPNWADEFWIDPTIDYPEPLYSLYQGDTGFMPLGDFQLIKAKKKSGKSYLCSIYAASILGCTDFGFTVSQNLGEPSVIIFDTEQSMENAARVERRIRRLAGIDIHSITRLINIFDLRKMDVKNRLEYIKAKMDLIKPTHVFVDGIVDLGFDYMESDQSTDLLTRLLAMTKGTDYVCSITGVLHTNKAEEDHNGRGFLGTESGNKCSEETEVVKSKDGFTFDVKMTDCRNRPIKPWSFSIDAHGLPYKTNTVAENLELQKLNHLSDVIKKSFKASGKDELLSKELNEIVQAIEDCAKRKATNMIQTAEQYGFITSALIGREKHYKISAKMN